MKSGSANNSFWTKLSLALIATPIFWQGSSLATQATDLPIHLSQRQQQRQQEWHTTLQVARLVNARQQITDLVVQLDILNKPETTYANAVYQVFARIDGRWREIYTNQGARLIVGQAGRVTLQPEVISIRDLQANLDALEINLAETELRVVAQVRYDVRGGRRDQRLEVEQIQAYHLIAQTTRVEIVTSTVTGSGTVTGSTGIPCLLNCGNDDDDDNNNVTYQDVVTLSNGYRVTFLGVSYAGRTSTWRYYVEELPIAQDLSNWVLELPRCARVVNASPRGELVNPDPNARLSGIKWQPGGGFVEGEFSVTLSGALAVGRINVAVKGPDVAIGELAGPTCGS